MDTMWTEVVVTESPSPNAEIEKVVASAIAAVIVLVILLCICYCCFKDQCCSTPGVVYRRMPTENRAEVVQQIVVNSAAAPVSYPMPPNAYPVQQYMPGPYMVPGAAAPSVPLSPTLSVPMPMGQPPPYTEVAQMQTGAAGVDPQEAYLKQAPYNPHVNPSAP